MRCCLNWERKGPISFPVEVLTYLEYVPVSVRHVPSLADTRDAFHHETGYLG